MNPMVVLSCTLAAAMGAPAAHNVVAHAPVAYAHVAAPAAVSVPAPYTTSAIVGQDTVHHSQAPAVVTKSLSFGSKDFVSGHVSAIHKPAIPSVRIQVPTALKGSVQVNPAAVTVQKEVHTVNEPVPVVKNVEVPFDKPVYKEQIVEVPSAVYQAKPVPVQVPYAVPGKQIVNIKHTAPIVKHTHSHHVAAPAVAYAHAQPAATYAYAQPAAAGYAYAGQPGFAYAAQPALQPAFAYAAQPTAAEE